MALCVRGLEATSLANLSSPMQLAFLALAGAAVYFATLRLIWPEVLTEVWAKLRKPKPEGGESAPGQTQALMG